MHVAFRRLVVAGCLALCCCQAALAQNRKAAKGHADWEPVPGYKYRAISGFNVLVNKAVLDQEQQGEYRRKPLEVLGLELDMLCRELPPKAVQVLRDVTIWVEWDKVETAGKGPTQGRAVACYHPGNNRLHRYSYDSLESAVKSNAIEIVTMKLLTEEHQGEQHRMVLLHEMTHAVHHHLFDYGNPVIKAAYQNAMQNHLYADTYAATNPMEYFAEISCAYFGHLHYEPHNREELKRYDPNGYHMMELTWGTPEVIAKALKVEAEKAAGPKLAAARRLLASKTRSQDGAAALEALRREYPNTKAAADAEKLLARHQAETAEKAKKDKEKATP